ncbi:hypothetical protein IQ268_21285 [Oculatella sp. LEGE 06141]|nr:hypothetical protein [Oculatella sp. LEGE 06141]MBE9181098.1 hypothetical protein [Oculatella sp. LEGE 06141]
MLQLKTAIAFGINPGAIALVDANFQNLGWTAVQKPGKMKRSLFDIR